MRLSIWILASSALLTMGHFAQAQSLWLEAGVGYRSTNVEAFQPGLKVGARGTLPISGPLSAFAAVAWRGGAIVDVGLWYEPEPGLRDPIGWKSHLGLGLSYHLGRFGLAGTAALSYEVTRDLSAFAMYSHRLLMIPHLDQAFDISVGLRVSLE